MAAKYELSDDSVVVVIGSGAGGGTLSNELAQKGVKVVLLEAGPRTEIEDFVNNEWEAFGMLLRGANAAGATVLAQNLHRVLGEQPARTSGGESIPLNVNVGTAIFPRDGTTAAELAQVAGKRVRR